MTRALTLGASLVFASGFLFAAGTPPPCPPVSLTVGSASTNGMVQFTLVGDSASLFTVQIPVSAGDSGSVIATKIGLAVRNASWLAQVSDDSVTFSHSGVAVSSIVGVVDTAGASLKLSTYHVKSYVEFQLDPAAVASGHGSTLTFSVPGEAVPLSMGLLQGQSAASVMDAVAAYLNSAGSGASYVRLSPTKVGIQFAYVNSWVSFQTNDAGLQGKSTQSDRCLDCGSISGLIQN
jgi:hypothetical protein